MSNKRRDPFAKLKQQAGPGQPVTIIPTARRKQRRRDWEKRNRARSYRGVPPETRDAIRALADHLMVTVDDVARAFLEYGLKAIQEGRLELNAQPGAHKRTLFAEDGAPGWSEAAGWPQEIPASKRRKSYKKKPRYNVSYRIPDSLHEQMKRTADSFAVPIGELATYLLNTGLKDWKAGKLQLHPRIIAVKQSLFVEKK